ncbi:amidohydrolase [Streptomyces sp. NPDC048639]|uniref:amidohydrolase n=1 Tax=Streptomyces sp. NPDC048639 TaxID=3365581 RepID=UPI003721A563
MDVPPDVLRPAVELCLDLHAHPELSGDECRTAGLFADRLEQQGCSVTRKVGGHGVVGVLRNGSGPTVMLRTELDALPVAENTGLSYTSTVPGVMHACGHDVHAAALAGATALLARAREDWRGTLLVVGQPAEETLSGARAMLEDGLYERFGTPDAVLAQHTAPLPAGTVAHGRGPVMAGSATLDIVIRGRGGHAGTPHLAVDPVVTAAAVVLRLQGVVSRETAPAEQVVLTVGSLRAGERGNVIPDRAELGVTVRAFSEPVLRRVTDAVERIVRGECAASGCPEDPVVTITSRSPALVPDPDLTEALRAVHTAGFGAGRVIHWPGATATEDFPWFGEHGAALHGGSGVRTAYWMLGVTSAAQWRSALAGGDPVPANHSPEFAPDLRTALPTGITAMTDAALHLLREAPR